MRFAIQRAIWRGGRRPEDGNKQEVDVKNGLSCPRAAPSKIRVTTKPRAPKITETQEHKTIASYFRKVGLGPGALAIHIRNESGSAWERMVSTQMGILKGVPDWLILYTS